MRILRPCLRTLAVSASILLTMGLAAPGHCASPEEFQAAASGDTKVFAINDEGMHSYDSDYSVFSLMPLMNAVRAQVVRVGTSPEILDNSEVNVVYRAMKDPSGSINKTSRGKTDFWQYMEPLYGFSRPLDVGLFGERMPGSSNTPRPFPWYNSKKQWFYTKGIPITATDDAGNKNYYPLMRVLAVDPGTGKALDTAPVVLSVSDEVGCINCHGSRIAILQLHDEEMGTSFVQDQKQGRPTLCASCHYSKPQASFGAGPDGGLPPLSRAIHEVHDWAPSCDRCHPPQMYRGVMSTHDINCVNCHGNMKALSREDRTPWVDEPKCQSCHTGDVNRHLGGSLILRWAYDDSRSVATPRLAENKRFAEKGLFKNSIGHEGIACETCHGSPHAIWPSSQPNDRLQPIAAQGHDGPIIECKVCHGNGLEPTLDGPHGMHPVNNPKWYAEEDGHPRFYKENHAACRACHGKRLEGTELSEAAAPRSFHVFGGTVNAEEDQEIGCDLCHQKP